MKTTRWKPLTPCIWVSVCVLILTVRVCPEVCFPLCLLRIWCVSRFSPARHAGLSETTKTQPDYNFTTLKTLMLLDNKTVRNADVCATRVRLRLSESQYFTQIRALVLFAFSHIIIWVRLEAEQSVIKVVRKPESNKSHSVSWVSFSKS